MGSHHVTLHFAQPPRGEVEVGARLSVRVQAACASGCDLRGQSVTVIAHDGQQTATLLLSFDGGTNETGDTALTVPPKVGEFSWLLHFAGDAGELGGHPEARLQLLLNTVAHQTGAAVWNVPTAVAVSELFQVRVGLQCLAGCDLQGVAVSVRNQDDLPVGATYLGPTTWPGTTGLHWADVGLSAPQVEGVFRHSLAIEAGALALAHDVPVTTFSIRVTARPEHTVIVRVIDDGTKAPISDVEVTLGPYMLNAGGGEASIPIAAGTHELSIRKSGYDFAPISVNVQGDTTITVAAKIGPSRADLEAQMSRFDDYPWG